MDTTSYLPARPSMNTFFVRHVAHPKRMVTIEGLNRAAICSVNDDGYLYGPIKSQRPTFPPNNFNEAVINSNATSVDFTKIPKKREKLLPPLGRFQPYGLIDDTDKWKDELSTLAASVGLLTEADVENNKRKQEREKYIKSLEQVPANTLIAPTSPSKQPGSPKKPPSSYSKKTSRLNEELNTGRRTSRGSLASRSFSGTGSKLHYVVDENEREVWMLQVLCQILQTDSLIDVQSWLVSSSGQEKEKVKGLIDNAMKGLQASGRIENATSSKSYMTPQATSVPTLPNDVESQVNLDQIQNMIEKMRLKTPVDQSKFSRHSNSRPKSSGVQNVLKISDTPVDSRLDVIPEHEVANARIEENDHKAPPISPVFNINIFQGKQKEEPSIKVDSPTKDYKIEELKVTMLVKDEKSNKLQKIENNWKPEESIPKI